MNLRPTTLFASLVVAFVVNGCGSSGNDGARGTGGAAGQGGTGGGAAGSGGGTAGQGGAAGASIDAGQDGGDAAFVPATWPAPNPCGLLTLADVQTLQPNIGVMYEPDPLITNDFWLFRCQWGAPATNPGEIVELDLWGAFTPAGKAGFGTNSGSSRDASVEAVTSLGTKAEYDDTAGVSQTLTAQWKSYAIELIATSFTPDVPESSLHPLVAKVIGEL